MNPLRNHYIRIDDDGRTVEVFEDSWLYVLYEYAKKRLLGFCGKIKKLGK